MALEPPPMQAISESGSRSFGLQHLLARLAADDRLEIAHHGRVRMRARHRADAIERVVHIGDPIAQRLVHRILQRLGAGFDGANLGAEDLHPEHVRLLPRDVHRAHVDDAGQAELRAQGGGGDAMHAGAGLGDDARLAHAPRQHDLAEHIVHLVRAGVIELLALEIDLGAAAMLREPLGEIERRRPADIGREMAVHLGLELRIGLGLGVGALQIEDQRHQRLGDEAAAIEAEMAALVRPAAIGVQRVWFGARAHERFGLGCVGGGLGRPNEASDTSSASFSPGARSTPEETSTSEAPVALIASPTVSAVEPPDSAKGACEPDERLPVEGDAVAAGKRARRRGLGIEQDVVGTSRIGACPPHIGGLSDGDRLHDRQARTALMAATRSGVSLP